MNPSDSAFLPCDICRGHALCWHREERCPFCLWTDPQLTAITKMGVAHGRGLHHGPPAAPASRTQAPASAAKRKQWPLQRWGPAVEGGPCDRANGTHLCHRPCQQEAGSAGVSSTAARGEGVGERRGAFLAAPFPAGSGTSLWPRLLSFPSPAPASPV